MLKRIKKLFNYLFDKRSELRDLDTKDALLAKVVLDIHRKRTHSDFVLVPLFSIKQIHAIDRDSAIASTGKRTRILLAARENLLAKREITRDMLAEYLPSVSGIKVVRHTDGSYIAYEGNGRLVALQTAFTAEDNLVIEVEEYHFKNTQKILRRMNRVRRLNGLL